MIKHHRPGNVSVARALSKLGYCSRSQAVEIIGQGRLTMDGKTVWNPSLRCFPEKVRFAVDGQSVLAGRYVYIIMNKPLGVVTTRSDERGRKTVYTILGTVGRWVFPVGRLDKDTSGLLILTNDTALGERLTNPASKVPKKYEVRLDRDFNTEDKGKFESGMSVGDETYLPARIRVLGPRQVLVTIREGKNRQLRRMFEAEGYRVVGLERTAVGTLVLGGLERGKWRYLEKEEVQRMIQTT